MSRNTIFVFFATFLQWGVFSQHLDSIASEKHVWLTDRFILELGDFSNSKSVFLRVDGNLPNSPINFVETMGLKREGHTIDLSFTWRFSRQKKWFASLNYFAVRNNQTVVLADELHWSNTIYPVGVALSSGFDVDMYRIFFGRVISTGQKHELSGGLGLHNLNIRSFVQATGLIGNFDVQIDVTKRNIDVLAPVPNIGIRYLYTPTRRWALTAKMQWFSLAIGDYKGTLWDISPAVNYQLFDNIGVGLSYKYFKAEVDMNRRVWRGSANLIYEGPLVSVSGNF